MEQIDVLRFRKPNHFQAELLNQHIFPEDSTMRRELVERFLNDHFLASRRYFLQQATGMSALAGISMRTDAQETIANSIDEADVLKQAIANLESWLTKPDDFRDVSRGRPLPHSLDEAKRRKVGLTRDTWSLDVVSESEPENKTKLRNELSKANGNAFTFDDLMGMAKERVVRFPKIMTCLNIGCPLGNGIWEGVPLRDILWLTQPKSDLRLVSYYGYHNDDPKQMFRSSLPVGRVLEDYHGLPPVILCYKLNGQWLTPERGGPVRVVVPEAYGFKSIKWLSHVVLSNRWKANDTYGEQNNDVDSPMKTFCEPLAWPKKISPEEPIAVTGYAQVGVAGLSKVQVWIQNKNEPSPAKRPYFLDAPWEDAKILGAPGKWGGALPNGEIPKNTIGFDAQTGKPKSWPIRLSKVHWAKLLPGLPKGEYELRCRTIDANRIAQPMPRPFRKSGRAAIAKVDIVVV